MNDYKIQPARTTILISQPSPQVFSVNSSIICGGLHFWRHFDVIGSIILGMLHFWRHWFNMVKILSKFGEQQLVMVNYACGFNQPETGKYFEWLIMQVMDWVASPLIYSPSTKSGDHKLRGAMRIPNLQCGLRRRSW